MLAPFGHVRGTEPVKPQRTPQPPAEPDIAEAPRSFQANLFQANRDRLAGRRACVEQVVLLASGDRKGQPTSLSPALRIELAKMGHRLLDDLAAAAHRTHQTPITMRLAVLVHRRMAQIHLCDSPNQNRTMTNKYQLGWLALHDSFSRLTILNVVRHQKTAGLRQSNL
jgi:hypothetical protein